MPPEQWRQFFLICHSALGTGASDGWASTSWCAWTSFESISNDLCYWTSGLPNPDDIGPMGISDGGTWGQPFLYADLAHLIIPARFFWERGAGDDYRSGTKTQDISRVAETLRSAGIPHRLTELVLEIKLY